MMETLKARLVSRKFWIGLICVIVGAVMCFTGDEKNGTVLIMIGGGGYLGAEGIADIVSRMYAGGASE